LAESKTILNNVYVRSELNKKFTEQELKKILLEKALTTIKVLGKEYFIPTYLLKTPSFLEKLKEKYREISDNRTAKMGERALADEFLKELSKFR
jgi:cAMP phosphodiesterase